MPATDQITATAIEGDTLDAIIWRVLGGGPALIADVLARNPGLADAGPVLAEGTEVVLPAALPSGGASAAPLVQLWS